MTSALSQVCKLWFGVCNGILPVKYLAPKILMAVNYFRHQQARMLGQAVSACHKKDGATRILEHASLACGMTGGLMSALGCGLGRRI